MGAQADAETATYELIQQTAEELKTANLHVNNKASAARDLAIAYRALTGGPQPGNVTIEK